MNAQELYEEYTSGESNGFRPKRAQRLRSDIQDATGLSVPHRMPELENWLETMQSSGVLTRKLKKASEGSGDENGDGGEDDEE